MELCNVKKFIELKKINMVEGDDGIIKTIIDRYDNVWTKEKFIAEGSYGKVFAYKSYNPEYADLAVKFFMEEDKDVDHEIKMIKHFNRYWCRGFIKSGVLDLKNRRKAVVMEKIDGDLTNLDFSELDDPIGSLMDLRNFLVESTKCSMKKRLIFLDIKAENMAYKKCEDGYRFTFVDYGSFIGIYNTRDAVATYGINGGLYKENYFDNQILFVYGVCMTLLSFKICTKSYKMSSNFDKFVEKLEDEEDVEITNYFPINNYDKIKKRFKYYMKKFDSFDEGIFDILLQITMRDMSVEEFIKRLQKL